MSSELSNLIESKNMVQSSRDSSSSNSSTTVDAKQDVEPIEISVPLHSNEHEATRSLIQNDSGKSGEDAIHPSESGGMNVNPHHNVSTECLECSCGGELLTDIHNETANSQLKLTCKNCSKEKFQNCISNTSQKADNSHITNSKLNSTEELSVITHSHVEPQIVITDLCEGVNHTKSDVECRISKEQMDGQSIASSFADTSDVEPILTQPLPVVATVSNYCPPGMEALLEVCQLVVHKGNFRRNIDISKTAVAKLEVVDISRKVIFFAEREPAPISAQSFLYKIYNADQVQVMEVYCPLGKTCVCCRATWHMCKCCKLQAMVSAPPGQIIGFIKRQHTRFVQEYHVLNPLEDLIFVLRGGALDLEIYTPTLQDELGRVAVHNWHGIMHEMKRTGDDYGVTFPMDLDVRVKATLLGMAFVLDWIFTTNSGKK